LFTHRHEATIALFSGLRAITPRINRLESGAVTHIHYHVIAMRTYGWFERLGAGIVVAVPITFLMLAYLPPIDRPEEYSFGIDSLEDFPEAIPDVPSPETSGTAALPYGRWLSYDEWKRPEHIRSVAAQFHGGSEHDNVRDALGRIYANQLDQKKFKLDGVTISTLLMFYHIQENGVEKKRLIKFQQISGHNDSIPPKIYYTAQTTIGARPAYVMFSLLKNGTLNPFPSHTEQSTMSPSSHLATMDRTGTFNFLVVAYYPELPEEGDVFWVEVPQYAASTANLYLGLLAQGDLAADSAAYSAWHVGVDSSHNGSIPLRYLEIPRSQSTRERQQDIKHINSFSVWFNRLDKYYKEFSKVREIDSLPFPAPRVLHTILEQLQSSMIIREPLFTGVTKSQFWRTYLGWKITSTSDPIAFIYNWEP
jgi:hypothetical protein